MTDFHDVLSALDGLRELGGQKWIARCPAHEDRSPSLSLTVADDRLLMHCHAQCSIDDVCGALGIERKDLFLDNDPEERQQRRVIKTRRQVLAEIRTELSIEAVYENATNPTAEDGARYALARERLDAAVVTFGGNILQEAIHERP